jgi:hypothetical protein
MMTNYICNKGDTTIMQLRRYTSIYKLTAYETKVVEQQLGGCGSLWAGLLFHHLCLKQHLRTGPSGATHFYQSRFVPMSM